MPKLPPPPRSPHSRSLFSVGLDVHELSVGGDDVRADEVVACEAVLPHQPPDAAAEREAGDAGGGDEAARRGEPLGLRLVVDVGPHRAAADGCPSGGGVDADAVHRGEVDDDPVVAGREARDAVAAAADGDGQVVAACEADGCDHVGCAGAADDQRRPVAVVRAVPDPAGLRVAGVGRGDDLSPNGLAQLLDGRLAEHWSNGLAHVVPFVVGARGGLSGVPLPRLSGALATARSRSSTDAMPTSSPVDA